MLLLILFIALLVSGILILIFAKGDDFKELGGIITAFSLVATIISLVCIQTPKKTRRMIEEYTEVKSLREAYTSEKMLFYKDEINKKVNTQNNIIDNAKEYSGSIWEGIFYSSEIADLPKLEYIGPDEEQEP